MPLLFQPTLESLLREPALLTRLVEDKHLLANLTEAFSATSYGMKNIKKIVCSQLGVAPGDQLADTMFNLRAKPLVQELKSNFAELGYTPELGPPAADSVNHNAVEASGRQHSGVCEGVSYVDDIIETVVLPSQVPVDLAPAVSSHT